MKFIYIALNDLLRTARDKKALLLMLLMPVVIITVLGAAFANSFKQSSVIEKFKIAFIDQDKGAVAGDLYEYLTSQNTASYFEVVKTTAEEADMMLKKHDIPAAVYVPAGFSGKIEKGETADLILAQDTDSPYRFKIVREVVSAFIDHVTAVNVVMNTAEIKDFSKIGSLVARMSDWKLELKASEEERKKLVSSFEYYAAAMAVMFILFSVAAGGKSLLEEKQMGTLDRLLTGPVKAWQITLGKFFGIFAVSYVQIWILILFTGAVFGARWGNNIPGLIVLTTATVTAASGLGMLLASVSGTARMVDILGQLIAYLNALLGGSTIPLMAFPDSLKTVSKFTINGLAIGGYSDLMENGLFEQIIFPSVLLFGFGLVVTGISSYILSKFKIARGV